MDAILNPYSPGAGSKPPALTGRDKEIDAFRVHIERCKQKRSVKSLLITGLRGVGKTVLLNTFGNIAETSGFKIASKEITHELEFRPMIAQLARRALLSISPVERMKDLTRKAAGILNSFVVKISDGTEFRLDVEAISGRADSGLLSDDLSDLFVALGEAAAEHGTGVAFLFDEIQFLSSENLEALIAAVHQISQRNLPVTVVGAGLPSLPRLAGEAKSYAERLFDFPLIDKLPVEAARDALERPAIENGARFDPAATDFIINFTDGYPYFLQEYGKHVWNIAPQNTITLDDARAAEAAVQTQLDENFFRVRIERSTKTEIRYLSAMASLGKEPYRSGDIAEAMSRKPQSLGPVRSTLIAKGLIYSREYGQNCFTVPRFADFMRRNFPYTP